MNKSRKKNYKSIRLKWYTWSLVISITITVLILIFFEVKKNKKSINDIAIAQALSHFNKDQAFRHWATLHGGIYVAIDSLTPPNPYLAHINERDITTPSGKELTLMNPAYMVRQLNEYFSNLYGISGHITSLNPLRPENKPDEWETNALEQFELGINEISEDINLDGEKYFRFMRPMVTHENCLKCHGHQGYKVGDIRGGVSIIIPEEEIFFKGKTELLNNICPIIIFWLLGIIFIIISWNIIQKKINERNKTEKKLIQKNMDLQAAEEEIRASNEELRVNSEELLETNTYLEKAKLKAEENDRLKTAFLANMSHEIRTPMNAILGFSSFLGEKDIDNNDRLKYINLIQSGANQLLQLINDIIDISRIETGQLNISKSEFELNVFMDEIESITKTLLANNDKNNLKFRLIKESPSKIIILKTDLNRLKQIYLNLISNAIKFTSEGGIDIGYTLVNETVQFFVKDTGIGIAKKKQAVIFKRFVQLEDHMTREYGGTGIGLAIVKGLLELLDGNIWLSSIKDKGSTFSFDLPHIIESLPKATKTNMNLEPIKFNFKDKTVLIVEDDESNYIYIKKLLENKNVNIIHASNGKQAIEKCRLHKEIDLVLMDIQLPILNGLEATKIIRSFDRNIPIIAQTAYAMLDDEKKCLDVGCNDYISKPIKLDNLFTKMKNLLN